MGRFWEIVTRTPPLVAPDGLRDAGGLIFGFAAESESAGWTVTGYGSDGRRLGRPLKGLSEGARSTLTRPVEGADAGQLRQLAAAWVEVCQHTATNADALTRFADAARRIRETPVV